MNGNAENQTRGCWMRSANATSVLCRPLVKILITTTVPMTRWLICQSCCTCSNYWPTEGSCPRFESNWSKNFSQINFQSRLKTVERDAAASWQNFANFFCSLIKCDCWIRTTTEKIIGRLFLLFSFLLVTSSVVKQTFRLYNCCSRWLVRHQLFHFHVVFVHYSILV